MRAPVPLALALAASLPGAARAQAPALACGSFTAGIAEPGGVVLVRSDGDDWLAQPPPAAPTVTRTGGAPVSAAFRFTSTAPDAIELRGRYAAAATGLGADLEAVRRFRTGAGCAGELALVEELRLEPAGAIRTPFAWRVPLLTLPLEPGARVFLAREDGRGVEVEPRGSLCAAFPMAGTPLPPGCVALAIPVVDVPLPGGRRLALHADPLWGVVFEIEAGAGLLEVAASWRFAADRVPFGGHDRRVTLHLHGGAPWWGVEAFQAAEALAPGPAWLEDVTLAYFDFMGDVGQGWSRDLAALAARVPGAERHRVAVALHGWFDRYGRYGYDESAGSFLPGWFVQPRRYGTSLPMDMAEVRRRLQAARDLGFRVFLYFADGVCIDSATPRGALTSDELGRNPWNGPDVEGFLRVQNPADPAVRAWFHAYLGALLGETGDLVDGLVWDETFWVRENAVATVPAPAHADVAMMTLTRELAEAVRAHDPALAFLTSDNLGTSGTDTPPYALMGHGTWQDAECDPASWSYGLFPNWRKPLWSVNWGAQTRFEDMRLGVLRFGAPVALANGWANDWGPAEMPADFLDRALELGEWLALPRRAAARPRFLAEEPAAALARPLPGELVVDCWEAAGPWPFTDDLGWATEYPPERGEPVAWTPVAAGNRGYVDLRALLGDAGSQVAYARARVTAPEATDVDLVVGSAAGVKVWMGGALVHANHAHRPHWPGADVVRRLRLPAGTSELLVKVEQTAGEWGFSLRLQDPLLGGAPSCVPPPRLRGVGRPRAARLRAR